MPQERLIELPITRACIEKWNAGRANHGAEFEGDPLEELFGELIDAINYADQAELEGFDVGRIRAELFNCATEVQELADNRTTAAELETPPMSVANQVQELIDGNEAVLAARVNDFSEATLALLARYADNAWYLTEPGGCFD
jgi:hypothetical protein